MRYARYADFFPNPNPVKPAKRHISDMFMEQDSARTDGAYATLRWMALTIGVEPIMLSSGQWLDPTEAPRSTHEYVLIS